MAWARSFLASRAHARERFASRFFARGAPVTKIGSRRGGRWLAGTAGAEGQFFLMSRGTVFDWSNRNLQSASATPDLVT